MKTTEINGVHPQTVRRYLRAMGIECPTHGPGNGFDITDDMARQIKAIHALLGDSNSVPTNGVSVSMEQAIALTKPARHLTERDAMVFATSGRFLFYVGAYDRGSDFRTDNTALRVVYLGEPDG